MSARQIVRDRFAPQGCTRYFVVQDARILAAATRRQGGYWRANDATGMRHSSSWCRTRTEALAAVLDD